MQSTKGKSAIKSQNVSKEVEENNHIAKNSEFTTTLEAEDDSNLNSTTDESSDEDDQKTDGQNAEDGDGDEKKKFPKMARSMRKRMTYLVSTGMSPEEARKLAMIPISEQTPELAEIFKNRQKPKKTKTEEEGIKVGVMPVDFPDKQLTMSQVESVKEAILDKMIEVSSDIQPNFLNCTNKPGWLALRCADTNTKDWLKDIIGSISPWEDAKLEVVDDIDSNKCKDLMAVFPKSETYTTEKILKLIDAQNKDLSAATWRVAKRTTKGFHIELLLSVNEDTFEKIKALNFEIKYKFGKVTLRQPIKNNQKTNNTVKTSTQKNSVGNKQGFTKPKTNVNNQAGARGVQNRNTNQHYQNYNTRNQYHILAPRGRGKIPEFPQYPLGWNMYNNGYLNARGYTQQRLGYGNYGGGYLREEAIGAAQRNRFGSQW